MQDDIRDKLPKHFERIADIYANAMEMTADSRIPVNFHTVIMEIHLNRAKRLTDAFMAENCPQPGTRSVKASKQAIQDGHNFEPFVYAEIYKNIKE